jgi:hypothetical protein
MITEAKRIPSIPTQSNKMMVVGAVSFVNELFILYLKDVPGDY